jgi:hypothetical protein
VTPTKSREHAIQLAKTDPDAALAVARGIDDPWFRSQALAAVARFSKSRQLEILEEAQVASQSADDPYKIVGASAWWIRAMIELGYGDEAARELPALIEVSSTIEHPVSRLEALFLLFQAVFHLEATRLLALDALVNACQSANSWKAGDRLQEAALMLAADYPAESEQVIRAMPEGKYKRQAIEKRAASGGRPPRPFFW